MHGCRSHLLFEFLGALLLLGDALFQQLGAPSVHVRLVVALVQLLAQLGGATPLTLHAGQHVPAALLFGLQLICQPLQGAVAARFGAQLAHSLTSAVQLSQTRLDTLQVLTASVCRPNQLLNGGN